MFTVDSEHKKTREFEKPRVHEEATVPTQSSQEHLTNANEMQALSTQAIRRAQWESNDSHKWQFNQMLYSCLE